MNYWYVEHVLSVSAYLFDIYNDIFVQAFEVILILNKDLDVNPYPANTESDLPLPPV